MLINHESLLLLGDASIIKLVFVIVVFIIWVFNNLFGEKGKFAKGKPPARPQVQPMQPNPARPEAAPAQPQLASEIEEFLKRAGQKRREKTPRKPKPAPVAKPTPPPKPARRLVARTSEDQTFEIATTQTIADQVQKHLDTRQFKERADHMVDDISKADDVREAHRRQVFDHKLGKLADTSALPGDQAAGRSATEPVVPVVVMTDSTSIAAMLANPQSLKQAIVMNEILSRPEHRW